MNTMVHSYKDTHFTLTHSDTHIKKTLTYTQYTDSRTNTHGYTRTRTNTVTITGTLSLSPS